MKYQNQRPDLADQIKTLVQSANSVKTVPHGIKTVNPGEGLQLLSGDGAEIFWDWETAAEYDTRISEGRAAIEQARLDLDKAEADLAAAAARLGENERILDALGPRVDAAESTVAQTSKDLTAVSGRLDATAGNLATLQGTVGNVQSAVLESDRKAAAAQTAADQASAAAGGAASKATAAQTTADQAKAAAGTADEAARAASGLAATKGEVIYQASAPTGSRAAAQNLWIRTTDNKPHTWNGSAWVAVTDKAATDAATAAATAQSAASTAQATADQAKADAAAAAQSATAAMTKAGQAQASADGKNTITRSVSPASQPGTAVGDTHFTMSTMGGGGVVTRQQRWDGSTWQDESVGHQVLASLDLGKATVGELDGAYIKANSILSNRVVVSAGENLIPDPTFLSDAMNTSRITGTAWRIGTAANGSKVLTTNSTTQSDVPLTGAPDGWMQVDSTAKYQLQMLAGGPDQLSTYLMLLFVDGKSKADGFQWVRGLTGSLAPKLVEWDLAALGGPVAVRPMIRRNPTPSGATNYWQQIGAVTFRRKVNTVLIEDGAVTGDKVEAQTVAAKVGQFVKVQAANVEVTGDLSARVVNAMDTNTKNLVVTESAILQHTTLLGTTVADQLNVRKLIRGRDAILSGTVDVAQLNVTGAMSAEIVRAMDIQARRGIFTEGLTAQDATLLGTTVAETLNAGTVAARIMTSGMLQTSTDTNRGVKIDNSGIRAWDTTGQQTIRLNGSDNLVQGTFQTGTTGARIKINAVNTTAFMDLYGNSGGLDHGTIYYDAAVPGKTDAALTLTAIKDYSTNPTNPSFRLFPTRGTFAFQGVWAGNTDPLKFVVLQSSAGLGPNAYATIRVPYTTPFPSVSGSTRVPVMSVESATGADVMATIVSQTLTDITVNVVNKSSGKGSGAIIVKIATFVTDMQW